MQSAAKTLRGKPLTCWDCGTQYPSGTLQCGTCGGLTLTSTGESRPRLARPEPSTGLPWPWALLDVWPEGGAVTISGGPGSGKSSLAALLVRRFEHVTWATAEQTGTQAGLLFARLTPGTTPDVFVFSGPGPLKALIARLTGGLLVVDSLTQAGGWAEQAELAELAVQWVRGGPGRRLLFILQVNGEGRQAGQLEIPHLVDTCCDVSAAGGLRMFAAWKHRHGPIGSAYFRLVAEGPVAVRFPFAYSVEGEPGRYRLHPWPMRGAEWAGLYDARKADGKPALSGVACAAIPVDGYDGGYLVPADTPERRAFAEAHGLRWIPDEEDDEP